MKRLNPVKFLDALASIIAQIDIDMIDERPVVNIMDRCARANLSLLMLAVDKGTERVIDEERLEFREGLLRVQVEVRRLFRKLRLDGDFMEMISNLQTQIDFLKRQLKLERQEVLLLKRGVAKLHKKLKAEDKL